MILTKSVDPPPVPSKAAPAKAIPGLRTPSYKLFTREVP